MQQFNTFKGTRGWLSVYESAVRFRHMHNKSEVRRRGRILAFWNKHGTQATTDAFGVSRRTLFRWKKALVQSQGKLPALDPKSTAPKGTRKRHYPEGYLDRVIELRQKHPRLGKKKIATILGVSESYAGRTLTDLKERGLLPPRKTVSVSGRTGRVIERKPSRKRPKHRRPKGYRVLEVDTVVRFIDGTKRYTLTAIDTKNRAAFAACYTNHGSASAADFLAKCYKALPDPPEAVQTDNGSEFAGYFDRASDHLGLKRFHTYPRSPKMNAHVERFNRTISEDFLCHNRDLMRDDVATFNEHLMDWLIWYNTEYPHEALGLLSPFQYILEELQPPECQMWWTRTKY